MCTECGFLLWSDEARKLGAHPECVSDDPPIDAQDLEEQLDEALKVTK